MSKAEPTPSTKRAGTRSQPNSGTGQNVKTFSGTGVAPGGSSKLGRATLSPSDQGKAPAKSTDADKRVFTQDKPADLSQRAAEPAPMPEMPPFVMYRDDAAKSERERGFSSWVSENKEHLIGAPERAFFPSPLERGTQAEIAKGDQYAGTRNTVTRPAKQAQ